MFRFNHVELYRDEGFDYSFTAQYIHTAPLLYVLISDRWVHPRSSVEPAPISSKRFCVALNKQAISKVCTAYSSMHRTVQCPPFVYQPLRTQRYSTSETAFLSMFIVG